MNDTTEVYRPIYYFISPTKKFILTSSLSIGRNSTDVNLNDSKLSSNHCQLNIRGIRIFIKDLNSTNGTFVNGSRIEADVEVEVRIGDRIRIGSHEYTIKDMDENLKSNNSVGEQNNRPESEDRSIFDFSGISLPWKLIYALTFLLSITLISIAFYLVPDKYPVSPDFFSSITDKNEKRALIYVFLISVSSLWFHIYVSLQYLKKSTLLKLLFFIFLFVIQNIATIGIMSSTNSEFMKYNEARYKLKQTSKNKAEFETKRNNFNSAYRDLTLYLTDNSYDDYVIDLKKDFESLDCVTMIQVSNLHYPDLSCDQSMKEFMSTRMQSYHHRSKCQSPLIIKNVKNVKCVNGPIQGFSGGAVYEATVCCGYPN